MSVQAKRISVARNPKHEPLAPRPEVDRLKEIRDLYQEYEDTPDLTPKLFAKTAWLPLLNPFGNNLDWRNNPFLTPAKRFPQKFVDYSVNAKKYFTTFADYINYAKQEFAAAVNINPVLIECCDYNVKHDLFLFRAPQVLSQSIELGLWSLDWGLVFAGIPQAHILQSQSDLVECSYYQGQKAEVLLLAGVGGLVGLSFSDPLITKNEVVTVYGAKFGGVQQIDNTSSTIEDYNEEFNFKGQMTGLPGFHVFRVSPSSTLSLGTGPTSILIGVFDKYGRMPNAGKILTPYGAAAMLLPEKRDSEIAVFGGLTIVTLIDGKPEKISMLLTGGSLMRYYLQSFDPNGMFRFFRCHDFFADPSVARGTSLEKFFDGAESVPVKVSKMLADFDIYQGAYEEVLGAAALYKKIASWKVVKIETVLNNVSFTELREVISKLKSSDPKAVARILLSMKPHVGYRAFKQLKFLDFVLFKDSSSLFDDFVKAVIANPTVKLRQKYLFKLYAKNSSRKELHDVSFKQ